jgi:type II secretory pathway pseudopilin PulG
MSVGLRQRGDTIIEVMLAFTVFAMLAVGAIAVMNRGTASSQDTLETTQVRQEIDNQAEMLRYLHQAYLSDPNATDGLAGEFNDIMALAQDSVNASEFGAECTDSLPEANQDHRFALNTSNGSLIDGGNINPINAQDVTLPYARVVNEDGGASYGLWVEPVLSNSGDSVARYVDFHIRACWESASSAPQRTLGTIVRLYIPANEDTGSNGGVTPEPIPLASTEELTKDGDEIDDCFVHTKLSVDGEANPSLPSWNPDTGRPGNTSENPGGCVTYPDYPGYLMSYSNFDVWYSIPVDFVSDSDDKYSLDITYRDMSCFSFCGDTDGHASNYTNDFTDPDYRFKVAIYINGDYTGKQFELPISPTRETVGQYSVSIAATSQAINIGQVEAGDVIQLRWWNNHYVNVGPKAQDPDLVIRQIHLKHLEPAP